MTYQALIKRLRRDLNDPLFFAYELPIPHGEREYQDLLIDVWINYNELTKDNKPFARLTS